MRIDKPGCGMYDNRHCKHYFDGNCLLLDFQIHSEIYQKQENGKIDKCPYYENKFIKQDSIAEK